MRIAIFTCSISRQAGGLFDAIKDLYLNSNIKDNLEIYSYNDVWSQDDLASWQGKQISLFGNFFFTYSPLVKKTILASDADLIHVHGLWRYPHLFMIVWKNNKNRPVVCSPHGMFDSYILNAQGETKRLFGRLLFSKASKAVDCFHALCKKELEDIRAYGLKQPVAIIPNGINLPLENKVYQLQDNKKHLLYLGRLHPKKGIDLIIRAIAQINSEIPLLLSNWVVDIVGWDHENTKASLVDLVKKHQLEKNIIFHGGLFEDDKARMYATSSAYILPSYGEGLPMTVLEAWSWKLPVLITDYCNLPEGFECDAAIRLDTNVDAVKNGIEKLFQMTDSELRQIGSNGFELVKQKFTWDISAQKMTQLYNWLIYRGDKPEFVFD